MTMQLKHVALACICLTSFVLVFQVSLKSDLPLSWDVWYHLRISRQFSEGEFVWDSGSFGPEGRPHSYPPLFHGVTALFFVMTDMSLVDVARILPPFIFTASIYTFYLLVKEVLDEKRALVACLFASVSPIILDRNMSYTPEALSFIFFNLGLYYYYRGNWLKTGVFGGLLVLTHGLSSTAFFSVVLVYTIFSFLVLKENYWKHFFKVLLVSGLIASFWILQLYPEHVPFGGKELLSLYPLKLGWIQTLLAFLGLTCMTKSKKSIFILSCAGSLFVLSQNPVSLPYRFIEFLAFPVCILAAQGFTKLNHKMYFVIILFLLSFAQGYWYTEKYSPVITHEEVNAFLWLNTNSVTGYTIITEWKTAPVLAFFSQRAPLKGAYQFGAPMLRERTEDTQQFYTHYDLMLVQEYEISYAYYGIEERNYQYEEPPFDKVFSTVKTGFYLL